MKPISAMLVFPAFFVAALMLPGCGTVPESTSDTWDSGPQVSVNARLEYRIDSLMNENRRLTQQVDALAAENRNLATRNTELESRASETPVTTPKVETPAPRIENVASGYDGALTAFRQRNFDGAIQGFEGLLGGGVGDDLADNCHYWIGESYYGMRKYREAIEHFRMVLDYKTSEKKDEAQLMIGNASMAMGDREGAREAYNKVISGYPVSPLVSKAQQKLARLK